MDYLIRDSFFSGVAEGVIGHDRLLTMAHVKDDILCIEEKGILSVEKFFTARRLMYLQVYLHKTVISAELLLVAILERIKDLLKQGITVILTDGLYYFLNEMHPIADTQKMIDQFVALDDHDIMYTVKANQNHKDIILSVLCQNLINRHLCKVLPINHPNLPSLQYKIKEWLYRHNYTENEMKYFWHELSSVVNFYSTSDEVNIWTKSGTRVPASSINPILKAYGPTHVNGVVYMPVD